VYVVYRSLVRVLLDDSYFQSQHAGPDLEGVVEVFGLWDGGVKMSPALRSLFSKVADLLYNW
jgi:hypothetical protein